MTGSTEYAAPRGIIHPGPLRTPTSSQHADVVLVSRGFVPTASGPSPWRRWRTYPQRGARSSGNAIPRGLEHGSPGTLGRQRTRGLVGPLSVHGQASPNRPLDHARGSIIALTIATCRGKTLNNMKNNHLNLGKLIAGPQITADYIITLAQRRPALDSPGVHRVPTVHRIGKAERWA